MILAIDVGNTNIVLGCMEDGKIVEEGDYDTLIQKGGFFAELVERQRLDTAG